MRLAGGIHVVAHEARIHSGGDLGRAGGLGTVADHAGADGQGIGDGMGHHLIAAALEVGDAGGSAAAGAHGAAERTQAANTGLLVDGHQV